jgi:hypothetical protein|tara:strand:+ start:1453 stop:1788 length:336 start_codon:yes stop_codon:yes gene_type:complete
MEDMFDFEDIQIDDTGSYLDGHCYHLMLKGVVNSGRKVLVKLLSFPSDLDSSLKDSEGLVVTRRQYEEMRIKRRDFENDPFLEREQFSDKELGRIRVYNPLVLNSFYSKKF